MLIVKTVINALSLLNFSLHCFSVYNYSSVNFLKKKIITIDGPAASGKGEIAKYISKKWKFKHLNSGILYQRLTYN